MKRSEMLIAVNGIIFNDKIQQLFGREIFRKESE